MSFNVSFIFIWFVILMNQKIIFNYYKTIILLKIRHSNDYIRIFQNNFRQKFPSSIAFNQWSVNAMPN